MAGIEQLVDELERSYAETQERMSDPSVYNDHRQAADVGRRLKELEGPYRLAQSGGRFAGGSPSHASTIRSSPLSLPTRPRPHG